MRSENVFLMSVAGKGGERIFATEIHKKKFLDVLAEETGNLVDVFGYCVLDEMCVCLLSYGQKMGKQAKEMEADIRKMVQHCMYHYNERIHEQDFDKRVIDEWEVVIRECSKEEVWQELLALHFLPVRRSYTVQAEDYWWSSYQEYLGRNWMHFSISDMGLTVREIKKEHREWKKKHPLLFK